MRGWLHAYAFFVAIAAGVVLCSLAADLHVTQAVDATKGVHATIAKALFR